MQQPVNVVIADPGLMLKVVSFVYTKKKTEKPTTVQKADVQKAKQTAASKRNKNVALLLCIFLGFLGVHNFYGGRYVKGLLFLFTFGLFGIGWICDIFLIISNIYVDADGLKLRTTKG